MQHILRNIALVVVVIVLAPLPLVEANDAASTPCNVTDDMKNTAQVGSVSDTDSDIWRHWAGGMKQNFVVETAGVGLLTIKAWYQSDSGNCWSSYYERCDSMLAGTPCALKLQPPGDHVWISIVCDDCFGDVRYAIEHFHSVP